MIQCPRCLPGEFGERIDVHTFGQRPCVHVGGEWEPPPPGAWRVGDRHECPLSSHEHVAVSECVVYALAHGDRLYRP